MDFEEIAKELWWYLENGAPPNKIRLIKEYLEDAFDEGTAFGYDNSLSEININRLSR